MSGIDLQLDAVHLEVVCSECGSPLESEQARRSGCPALSVTPCEHCLYEAEKATSAEVAS